MSSSFASVKRLQNEIIMKRIYTIIILSMLLLPLTMKAQDTTVWTLRSCLDYALEHNIQLKKSKITRLSGLEDTELAKAQLFPSLSASVTQGFVNYPSKEAVSNNSYSGNYSVNASWKLFDGNKRVNAIKQQKIQNKVDELNVEQNEDDIQIAIVQNYMQVLYATEAVANLFCKVSRICS